MVGWRRGVNWAGRGGLISYGEIDDGTGTHVAWDDDINRGGTGLEYYLSRDVRLKGVVQLNWRDGAPDDADHMVGAQLATSF